jgi:hypothetical protein
VIVESGDTRGDTAMQALPGTPARASERAYAGTPPASLSLGNGIPPVCMFLTSDSNVVLNCMGCVGQKGEKFCTRRRNGSGEQDTCGIQSHAKKANFASNHLYFWDDTKNQGYVEPPLSMTYSLGASLYDMRGEDMTRVEFNELVGLIIGGQVTAPEELLEVKERLTRAVPVSFTPRKKPRFSTGSLVEYTETDLLPSISEAPEGTGEIQEHMIEHWSSMVRGMKMLKTMGSKHSRYESEILRLSDDIDTLNVSSARLENLVGSPADGIQFDLFGIVDKNEETLLEVGDELTGKMGPRLTRLENTTDHVSKEVLEFKSKIGGDVVAKLKSVEASLQLLEATSISDAAGPTFSELRHIMMAELIPATKDLWNLYMVATEGPGKALRPGSGATPGGYLFSKLAALGDQKLGSNDGGTLENRVTQLEDQAGVGLGQRSALPSIFGTSSALNAPGPDPDLPREAIGGDPALANTVALLEAKVKDLDAQLGNVTVTCGNFTFSSVDDCEAFVLEHVPGNTYAYFYDMMSLLQRGWGETHVSVSAVWDSMYSLKKAGFTCKGEAVIYASMSTILPTCLGELTGKTAESTNAFPSVPSYGHWTSKGGQMGRRHDISKSLHSVRHTLETQQKAHFAKDWMGAGVAKELLTNSFAHWTHFNTMMDDFYNEFSATGSAADAWKLTCLIGKAVLEAVHLVRCVAADVSDLMTPAKRAARMLWATLQAHRVLNEFILAEFRNDPRVAPIIVLHLLENRVGRCELEKLEKRMVSQDAVIAKMRKDMDKLTTSLGKQGKRKNHNDVAEFE